MLPIPEELQLLNNEWVPGDPVYGFLSSGYARQLFELMRAPDDEHFDAPMVWSSKLGPADPGPWTWLQPDESKLSEARERMAA